MSLLDWNSIENSRHGITDSKKGPYGNNPPPLNEFVWNILLVDFKSIFFYKYFMVTRALDKIQFVFDYKYLEVLPSTQKNVDHILQNDDKPNSFVNLFLGILH